MATRRLLVLARLDPEQKRVLGVAATANKLDLAVMDNVEAALAWLDRNEPRIVVFDTGLPKAERLCAKVRSNKALASVPIIGMAFEINDALAPKFYGMGADDLIPATLGAPLMARLRAVPTEQSLRPPPDRGKAIVADADKTRGDVFGRVLLNAGYDVKYALDATSLGFYAQQPDVRVIVSNSELGDPKAAITSSRAAGSTAVWIITAQRRDLEGMTAELGKLEQVRVMGLGVPPENVLFTSNELISQGARFVRASARVLYGTVVLFRDAGGEYDEIGFTYNLSAGGVYVRTLAPMPSDRVWLELRPPRAKQRVRLEGHVAWRRSFFEIAGATVPPGFGLELINGLGEGLAAWRAGYAELADHSAPRRPPPPPPRARVEIPIDVVPAKAAAEEEIADADLLPATDPPPPWPASSAAPEIPRMPAPPQIPVGADKEPAVAPPTPVSERAGSFTPPRKKSRAVWVVFVVLGAIAGAAAALFAVGPEQLWALVGPKASSAPPAATATDASTAPAAPAADASREDAPDSAIADAAAEAARSADAASEKLAAGDLNAEKDGSDLLASQGYLLVTSAGALDVYSTGAKIGPTNAKNVSRCGLRYVRLGEGDPVSWKSQGQTVDVKCQGVTEVSIEPLP